VTGCSHAASATVVFMMTSNSTGVQTPEGGLPAVSVVGPFDPGHDRDAELFSGVPGPAVEEFFWSRAKNDSMAALSSHEATRPIDPTKR
jgi:hypothetical protein